MRRRARHGIRVVAGDHFLPSWAETLDDDDDDDATADYDEDADADGDDDADDADDDG